MFYIFTQHLLTKPLILVYNFIALSLKELAINLLDDILKGTVILTIDVPGSRACEAKNQPVRVGQVPQISSKYVRRLRQVHGSP